jgi:hypothetical protein
MTRTGHPKRLVQLALSLFAIIVGVAYWFATKETIKRSPNWTRIHAKHDARTPPASLICGF